jgi:hypothetical protein
MKTIFIISLILLSAVKIYASEPDLFESINNKKSSLSVEVKSDKSDNTAFTGDEIIFYITPSKDCNVILIMGHSSGEQEIIFPNSSHPDFECSEGTVYEIPGFNMEKIFLEGPEGTVRLKAIGTDVEDFFVKFPELSEGKIKNVNDFFRKLKEHLDKIPQERWTSSDLEIDLKNKNLKPSVNSSFNTDYAVNYYKQGKAYYDNKEYDKAIEQFKKASKASPDSIVIYYATGLCYQAKGDFKNALSCYKKCIDCGIKERDCYIRVAEMYDQAGNKKEAYVRYKKALRITEGYKNIGDVKVTDITAEKFYNLALACKDNPKNIKSIMELTNIYEQNGDYKAGNYYLKNLLREAVPLYKPYKLEEDKPPMPEKPVPPVVYSEPAVYYEPAVYTDYAPYVQPYIPPPPPDFMVQ